MEQYGYPGLFFLIFLENVFPPIPSEVILPFGGFLTIHTALSVPGVVCFATLGSLAGAVVLYGAGYLLNRERLTRLVDGKVGKLLRLKGEDIAKADEWFRRKGRITVFFCRCVPVVRGWHEPHGIPIISPLYRSRNSDLEHPFSIPWGVHGRILELYCLACGGILPCDADYTGNQRPEWSAWFLYKKKKLRNSEAFCKKKWK